MTLLLNLAGCAGYGSPNSVQANDATKQPTSRSHKQNADSSAALRITTSSLPGGQVQVSYNATLAATGGTTPYSWGIVAGSLPPGLALGSSTGAIAGMPSASGQYSFTVQVIDPGSSPQSATKAFTVSVGAPAAAPAPSPLQITTSSLPGGQVQVSYNATLAATGGTTPYSWGVVSGSFPPGLTLGASSGVISGTPTQAGQFGFIVQVKDSATQSASQASISIATQSSGSPAPGPNDTIIFQDGFEGGSLSQWYIDGTNSGKFAVVSSPVHSGSHSLQAIPDGTATKLAKWYLPGYDEVYTKFYVQFASPFVYNGHMFVVAGNQTSNQWSSLGQAGIRPSGTDYFYAGIDPEFYDQHGYTPGLYPFQFYSYWPQMSCPSDYSPPTVTDCWGNTTTQTAPEVANTTGVWHEVVHHIKMNTIGNSDGLQELWIDGQKEISQTGMQWRTSTILKVNMFAIEFFMSPPPSTEYAWVDDVQVWAPAASGLVYNNPGPTVSSVSPNTGPTAGGTSVSITGANFLAGALVFFGGVPASGIMVNSGTQIQVVTPANAAGTVDVTVQNPDSQSAKLASGFTYTAPAPVGTPTITPQSLLAGMTSGTPTITPQSLLAGMTPANFTIPSGWSVVLTDGFENGNFNAWTSDQFDPAQQHALINTNPSFVHSGSDSFGSYYNYSSAPGAEVDSNIWVHYGTPSLSGMNHFYVSGYVFFHNNGSDTSKFIGRKLYYYKSYNPDGSYPIYFLVSATNDADGSSPAGSVGRIEVSWYDGVNQFIDYLAPLYWEQWYQIELELQLSDTGASNGFYNLYVNGKLWKSHSNISTRLTTTNGINAIYIGDQVNIFGGTINEYRYWDDIIILKK